MDTFGRVLPYHPCSEAMPAARHGYAIPEGRQQRHRGPTGFNERFASKTILITGAAGFLGTQFVHYFLTLNDRRVISHPRPR